MRKLKRILEKKVSESFSLIEIQIKKGIIDKEVIDFYLLNKNKLDELNIIINL